MATEKVFAEASPAAQVSVPRVSIKSQRGDAVPFVVPHGCKPASSTVTKLTEAGALVAPERVTLMSTRGPLSATEKIAALN